MHDLAYLGVLQNALFACPSLSLSLRGIMEKGGREERRVKLLRLKLCVCVRVCARTCVCAFRGGVAFKATGIQC